MIRRAFFAMSLAVAGALATEVDLSSQLPGPAQNPAGTGLIIGQVVDGVTGRGVPEAVVTLTPSAAGPSPTARGALAQKLIADGNGRFVYRALTKGRYFIGAVKPGYGPGSFGKVVPRGPGSPLDLGEGERVLDARVAMWKQGSISGRVVDEAGDPIVAIQVVSARQAMQGGRPVFTPVMGVMTDDRGVFRIPNLDSANYIISVPATATTLPAGVVEDYFRATGATRSEMQQALFQAAPTMSSPGSAANQVIGAHLLQVQGRMPTPPPTDGDGNLALYPSVFYPTAATSNAATVIRLASGEHRNGVDFRLRPVPTTRVSGTVDGPDGPASFAMLMLLATEAGEPVGTSANAVATTVTDARGAFTFLGVPTGQFFLVSAKFPSVVETPAQQTVVQLPGGTVSRGTAFAAEPGTARTVVEHWVTQRLTVVEKGIQDLRITLRPGYRVSGKVVVEATTATRLAAERSAIFLESTTQWLQGFPLENPVRADGTFTTPAFPPGRYHLTVPLPQGWFVKSVVAQGSALDGLPMNLDGDVENVIITVSDRGASVSGTVRDRDNRPDPNAMVVVFPVDSRHWGEFSSYAQRMRDGRTARDGTFSLGDLPPGEYLVAAGPPSVVDWSLPNLLQSLSRNAIRITLTEAERRMIDLRAAPGK